MIRIRLYSLGHSMKAIVVENFGGPEVMEFKEISRPTLGKGEVLIKLHACGVNPVDTYVRSGVRGGPLPYTPGLDGAGTVAEVGDEVVNLRVGDRVFLCGSITGTYAEYAVCSQAQVQPLPDNVSFVHGAGVFVPYGTAYTALFLFGEAKPGEVVLIHGGSGGVGIAAIQFARARGLTVIATAGTERGCDLVLREGAHYAVNHNDAGYESVIVKLAGSTGVNLIIEMLANKNLQRDLELLSFGGRVVVVGNRGTIEINPRDMMSKSARILGFNLLNIAGAELAEIYSALQAGLRNETLRPVLGMEFPLKDAAKAHVAILEPGSFGKMVLVP
jgi:NADPH2:quinone reductase